MLSTFPATFQSETMFLDTLPCFSNSLPNWDFSELVSHPIQTDDPTVIDGILQPSQNTVIDERKRKQKISNRESAKRSRMRKQEYLENMTNHLNRLRYENRRLKNRLMFVTSNSHRVIAENEQLRYEQAALKQRLAELSQVLAVRQLMHGQFTSTSIGFSWPCNSAINYYVG